MTGSPGQRYVELALRLTRLDEGLVDSYFGPPRIAQAVKDEPMPEASDLVDEADGLLDDLR